MNICFRLELILHRYTVYIHTYIHTSFIEHFPLGAFQRQFCSVFVGILRLYLKAHGVKGVFFVYAAVTFSLSE